MLTPDQFTLYGSLLVLAGAVLLIIVEALRMMRGAKDGE